MKRELRIATLLAVVAGVATYAVADRHSTLAQSENVPVGSNQPGPIEPTEVQDLFSRLVRITGPDHRDCGDFIRRSGQESPATTTQLERAVACAEAAAASKTALWLATGGFRRRVMANRGPRGRTRRRAAALCLRQLRAELPLDALRSTRCRGSAWHDRTNCVRGKQIGRLTSGCSRRRLGAVASCGQQPPRLNRGR